MGKLLDYIEILKPKQWIKNFIITIPLILSGNLFNFYLYPVFILAFIILNLVSSIGYIVNDITDIEEDRINPIKKNRPFASGRVNMFFGISLSLTLFAFSLLLSYLVPDIIPYLFLLIILDSFYNFHLRETRVFDVISLASKYPVRVMIGYTLLNLLPDWNILLSLFFLACCLAILKRTGEKREFKEEAYVQRGILGKYSIKFLDGFFFLSVIGLACNITLIDIPLISLMLFYICIFRLVSFYMKVDYKKTKSLAVFKDKWFTLFGLLGSLVLMVTLYW